MFAKPLSDGSVAVGLFNRGSASVSISATAAQTLWPRRRTEEAHPSPRPCDGLRFPMRQPRRE
ncbi:hypothetical protein ALI22I_06890 [Saccharothrix sp. ALI-22-I]|uniref:hypothetical protein n=1 Tax=Saccharothrix sp. ALI-22-I TaxID=1933778 RepID=UPI00097BCA50|nr:hypothetical protein [Saccharothrix sp. ALI-22-I]ONI91806.1 hypothetical protein ALI22I_06890 [Saccharothrix sp. ALI-22-I]